MANVVTFVKKGLHFISEKMWKIRLDKVGKRQGILLKQLRIFSLSINGFNEDNCMTKATALTFYTLFSLVPIMALVFAISKGFGFEKSLQEQILNGNQEYADVLKQVFVYANSMLDTTDSTHGGLIAGIGVVLLLWSVMKLLISIESSFNEIWEIKEGRTWYRKVTDYLTIMIIAPVFIFISGSLTLLIQTKVSHTVFLSDGTTIILKCISFLMVCGVFTFIYMVLPNTKVTFRSAFFAAVFAAVFFELLQWAYVSFQIGAVSYNKIYGGFAALPLFLIWIQYSWYIVMFGAELAFANQNVQHYELENEIKNISVRYKRVIALMICNRVVKNFNEGKKALTAVDIAKNLDLPVRLSRTIINELVETKIFNEVKTVNDKETAYQPGISDAKLSVKFIMDKLDEKGVNALPIADSTELSTINRLMSELDQAMDNEKGNILIKDIC